MTWSGAIRRAMAEDLPLLRRMLFEAFFWRPEQERPPFDVFAREPHFGMLLDSWGRAGDTGVVAEENGAAVGAAWYRFWTDAEHSYGYVDARTPELGIALVPTARRRGIGTALLRGLLDDARRAGVAQISLSVEPENFARRLYERVGFRKVGESGTAWTMLLPLTGKTP